MPDYGDVTLVDETVLTLDVPDWVGAATLRSGDRGLPGSGLGLPEPPEPDRDGELVSTGSGSGRD